MKTIRNINVGWFLTIMSLFFFSVGIPRALKWNLKTEYSILDEGGLWIGGISLVTLGILTFLVGIYKIYYTYKMKKPSKTL